jgi:saccharopine dehydrogenase (NAD+, L-lysine forming)
MKIGILRETKTPPDRRVPLTPAQCSTIATEFTDHELVVQPSPIRCFSDDEYRAGGIVLQEDLVDCDILLGVKEVKPETLIPGKTCLFFSHTAKEQPYNRKLLQAIARKKITLVDYEYLTRADKTRVVAFGRWAGIVGAYNGLRAYGMRTGAFHLEPAWGLRGLNEMKQCLENVKAGRARISLTGGGRVAQGAVEILRAAGIREVTPEAYLEGAFNEAVFCRLDPWHYTRHRDGREFDFTHFISSPAEYENAFIPYAKKSDMYIACHFWDPDSPVLLSSDDLRMPDISLVVIADISCDIDGPIASTIRASTIEEPLYGYDPATGKEVPDAFAEGVITVMAVDNLPGELPRDASEDFGRALMEHVIPALLGSGDQEIVGRATIMRDGELTQSFSYLENYLNVKD